MTLSEAWKKRDVSERILTVLSGLFCLSVSSAFLIGGIRLITALVENMKDDLILCIPVTVAMICFGVFIIAIPTLCWYGTVTDIR